MQVLFQIQTLLCIDHYSQRQTHLMSSWTQQSAQSLTFLHFSPDLISDSALLTDYISRNEWRVTCVVLFSVLWCLCRLNVMSEVCFHCYFVSYDSLYINTIPAVTSGWQGIYESFHRSTFALWPERGKRKVLFHSSHLWHSVSGCVVFELMLDDDDNNTYCCSLFLDACVMLVFFHFGGRVFLSLVRFDWYNGVLQIGLPW